LREDLKSPFVWLPRTPFWSLVAHFIKRLLAADEEQSDEGMSLGLGVVLAILALPGAFASIFLLDKYSTLLQWLRGQRHFDFYKASAADEYFFVVLSMTITGLVMVMRWNRLFPDRRDFANLAPLPIPIYQVFLANFTALLGLAVLFAVDVNAVSSFFFSRLRYSQRRAIGGIHANRGWPRDCRLQRQPVQLFWRFRPSGCFDSAVACAVVAARVRLRANTACGRSTG